MSIPRPIADYIRSARRLRWQYRDRPAQMHRRLRELSRIHRPNGLWDTERLTPERAFMQLVQQHLAGGVLRHDDRLRLLAIARRQSIKPFEANLLIALTQHQGNNHPTPARQSSAWMLAVVAVIVQSSIVGMVLWLIR